MHAKKIQLKLSYLSYGGGLSINCGTLYFSIPMSGYFNTEKDTPNPSKRENNPHKHPSASTPADSASSNYVAINQQYTK